MFFGPLYTTKREYQYYKQEHQELWTLIDKLTKIEDDWDFDEELSDDVKNDIKRVFELVDKDVSEIIHVESVERKLRIVCLDYLYKFRLDKEKIRFTIKDYAKE